MEFVPAFVALFVIVDPPAMGPVFLGLTQGMTPSQRRTTAIEACVVAFAVLAGAALVGEWLLDTLGIGLPAFRIAGGLLLFVIGFEMLFERRQERKAQSAQESAQEREAGLAVFPLAIPLMAGPGAITASVLLSSSAGSDWIRKLTLIGVFAAVIAIALVVLLLSSRFERFFGIKAQLVFSRLLGILLAAMAVQYVVDGIQAAISGGPATASIP